jgi:hypothetical protein
MAYEREVKEINEKLERIYGRNLSQNKANFRLVMAGDQFEKRRTTIDKFDNSENYIGQESGILVMPKYGYIPDNHWVVERLIPNCHKDVIESDFVYEPIYAFRIFPIYRAIEFLLYHLFHPSQPKSEKEAKYLDEEKKKKEIAKARNMLDSTVVESALHDGSAAFIDSTKRFKVDTVIIEGAEK